MSAFVQFKLAGSRLAAPEASMAATERITMTMRELDRFKVIQAVADGMLKPWRAAQRLGLTTRQIRRLVARLREDGPGGLVSRRRSKPSNNRLDAVTATRALSIIRERYADFGPTLACEKLYECHGILLAKETIRRLMTDAGLWVPRQQRPPKVYQPRARRACLGELVQISVYFESPLRRASSGFAHGLAQN
jgi:transposase